MRPLKRSGVSKRKSAVKFRRNIKKTKAANLPISPMRGGWRM